MAGFRFFEEVPSRWSARLDALAASGETEVTVPIRWGVHETWKGVRDFESSARCRLERALKLCLEHGLTPKPTIEFPTSDDAFPSWVWQRERKAMLAVREWNGRVFPICQMHIPRFLEIEVIAELAAFASDVCDRVKSSCGDIPLRYSPGILERDGNWSANYANQTASALEERYEKIERLNEAYQTAFRHFVSVTSSQGFQLLHQRRAWLSVYDQRWCRYRGVDSVLSKKGLARAEDSFDKTVRGDVAIAIDPNFMELSSGAVVGPIVLHGLTPASAIKSYRLAEMAVEWAERSDAQVDMLPLFSKSTLSSSRTRIILSGPYLSRASFQTLEDRLLAGETCLFPFGLPQYDENLKVYEWGVPSGRLAVSEERLLPRRKWGNGWIADVGEPLEYRQCDLDTIYQWARLLGERG